MKKGIIATLFLLLNIGIFGQMDIYKDPIKYNDYIINIVNVLSEEYTLIMQEEVQYRSEVLVRSFAATTTSSVSNLKQMKPFRGDKTFRDATIKYVEHLDRISHNELPEFMDIIFKDSTISNEGQDRLDIILPIISDQRLALFDHVVSAQKIFATKFKFKLDGVTDPIKIDFTLSNQQLSKKPIVYHDYIIDMVNYLNEAYSDIMEQEDEDASKILVDSFAINTHRCLAKLTTMQAYQNDDSFRNAAKEFVAHLDRISHYEVPEFMTIIFGDDILSEKNQTRLDELILILADQRTALFDQLISVQKTFATKFNFKIKEAN